MYTLGQGKQMCAVCYSTNDSKISCVCLSPHTELPDTLIAGDTTKLQPMSLKAVHTEVQGYYY